MPATRKRNNSKTLDLAKPAARPPVGEITKRQVSGGGYSSFLASAMAASRCATANLTPAPAGTYTTYRDMRACPTIAIARMAATAPIKAVDWSFEADDDAPPGALELIESTLNDDAIRLVVRDMLLAFDYGNQPFEIVWDVRAGRLLPVKVKPLLPDHTQVLVDADHGRFAGLKNRSIPLPVEKSLLFTYDGEAGNFYGRSRHENIREHIWPKWLDGNQRMRQYAKKVAGVIPMIRYPDEPGKDEADIERPGFQLAKGLAANLMSGEPIIFPAMLSRITDELIRAGADVDDIWAWNVQFHEVKTAHGGDLIAMQKATDAELVRGWLVPERAILEGQFGTKAEAEAHADFVLLDANDTVLDIAMYLNWHLVDRTLALNFGDASRGSVRLVPAPLVDEKAAVVRKAIDGLLTNPTSLEAIAGVIDINAMLDQTGIPRREDAGPIVIRPPVGPAPAVPPGAPTPGGAPLAGEKVADTALNGAQVTAAKDIVIAVASGEIPRDSGVAMLARFFMLSPEEAESIMGSAGTKTPTTPNPRPPGLDDDPAPQPMTAALLSIQQASLRRLKHLSTKDN